MRHLSLRRFPPLPHEPRQTPLQHVRGLSAASAESSEPHIPHAPTALAAVDNLYSNTAGPSPSIASPHAALPMSATLLSRLSRRQMRQREQQWGALWRYRPESIPSPGVRGGGPQLRSSTPATAARAASVGSSVESSAFLLPSPQHSVTEVSAVTQRSVNAEGDGDGSGPRMTADGQAAFKKASEPTESFASLGATAAGGRLSDTPSSPFSSPRSTADSSQDPLLAFLETHEEDAAELIAMWTSLHRSCVYASELSESVVLQVRYFFHSLLHNRAIAAAVEFYHRLMGLGVQLQQSDLLLLIASLPYEHAVTAEPAQLRRAEEDAAMVRDRRIWEERRRHFKAAAASAAAAAAARYPDEKASDSRSSLVREGATGGGGGCTDSPHSTHGPQSSQTEEAARHTSTALSMTAVSADAAVASVSSSSAANASGLCEAHPPSSIARRVAFHQQPEWIKRWILYEASMGTLDGLDSSDGVYGGDAIRGGSAPTPSSAAPFINDSSDGFVALVDSATAAETAVQTQRAARVMEVAAIVDHLRLLTLGAMQRDAQPSPRREPHRMFSHVKRRRRFLLSSKCTERLYWREATHVVQHAFATPVWGSTAHRSGTVEEAVVLSADITGTLRAMMREANTWEGALAVCRIGTPSSRFAKRRTGAVLSCSLSMQGEDQHAAAVLFTALAADSQPWKTHAAVEEWMHQHLLPQLGSRCDPSTLAIQALWLSHLCGVKAARPEQFIVMTDEVAAYLPAAPVKGSEGCRTSTASTVSDAVGQLLHGDLASLAASVLTRTEAATAAFHAEVQQSLRNRRAAQVLAKSIQSGAYTLNQGEERSGTGAAAGSDGTAPAVSIAPLVMPPPSAALLTPSQLDSFVLCCAAVREAVWLRFRTAAAEHPATVAAEVLQFVHRVLYGPAGLHTVFHDIYGASSTPQSRSGVAGGGNKLVSEAESQAAPERALAAVVLARTLLELAQLLCTSGSHRRRLGGHVSSREAQGLLVELARRAVDGVQVSHTRAAPWRWATEARVEELVKTTARTIHAVVRELDISPRNEKVVFGALPERDVQLLADLARLILKTTDLTAAQQTAPEQAPRRCAVWRVLTRTVSTGVLQGVQLAFRKNSALGKRVRHHLTAHESSRLDALLHTSRRRYSLRTSSTALKAPQRSGALAGVAATPSRTSAADFVLAMALRASVYGAVQRESNVDGVRTALQKLAEASTNWKASLRLCELVTKDMALARGTCNVQFFQTVLEKVTEGVAEGEAAAGRSRVGSGGARDDGYGRGKGVRRTAPAGPPSLWLSAIDVFWSAVDHTTGTAVAPTEASLERSTPAPSETPSLPMSTAELQERAVLAQLLLPLIDFSRTVRRHELGRQWRRVWVSKYSAAERQTAAFRRRDILALSLLRDDSALSRCVADYALLGHDEALLCQVAGEHRSWQRGLEAIFSIYGTIEEKERAQACYSLTVARGILHLLRRSPQNLSNTAMRLETLQGAEWDAASSAAVVQLLLRGRRWSLALKHVDGALARVPSLQRLHAALLDSMATSSNTAVVDSSEAAAPPVLPLPALSPQAALPYVRLLTLALQATAIGGDSEAAPRYYDALKLALHCVSQHSDEAVDAQGRHGQHQPASQRTVEAKGAADDELDTIFDMANPADVVVPHGDANGTSAENKGYAELRDLAARARMLFFRAMTKKMMSSKASAGDLFDRDD